LFDRVQEIFRDYDYTSDNIYAGLRSLGIDAQIAERGRAEENIECGENSKSLGMIDIPEGPIRWVNVIKRTVHQEDTYYIKYGVGDARLHPGYVSRQPGEWEPLLVRPGPYLRDLPEARIKSVRTKTFPVVGRVIDLHWKGKDFGLGIIDRLNSDMSIRHVIMSSGDVEVSAHRRHECWVISEKTDSAPSLKIWNCYQRIAQYLLAEWSRS